jgi:hypothetical protein
MASKIMVCVIVLSLVFCQFLSSPSHVKASEPPRKIGIQAGHWPGPGASSADGKVNESEITYSVANKVVAILNSNTQLNSWGPYTAEVLEGNQAAVSGYNADAFVALHCDWAAPGCQGFKVSRFNGQPGTGLKGDDGFSDRLVTSIWSNYKAWTGLSEDRAAGHFTTGMLQYYALNPGIGITDKTPGAIMEMGWLSGDLAFMTSPAGQQKMAQGIANAIINFLKPTDLVFVIDTTGSMSDDIDQVKIAAADIIKNIDEKVKNYRIALVAYRDFPVDPYGEPGDYPALTLLAFSRDKTEITNAINLLGADGGNDTPESVYTALIHSILNPDVGGWRDYASKQVILMGDAPPHDPEPFTGYTLQNVVQASESVDPVVIQAIVIGSSGTTLTTFENIATSTEGNIFTAANASEIVQAIMDAIGEAIEPSANTPPVADNQEVITSQNQQQSITLTANDIDGNSLTYSIVTWPLHGTLSGSPPNLIYIPETGYQGEDSFSFKANDGIVDSSIATVHITIRISRSVPTLSQWGITGLIIIFATAMVFVMRRRYIANKGESKN